MPDNLADDLIVGLRAIGDEIGRTPRQAQHLIHIRQIPAFRLGGQWASTKSALRRRISDRLARAAEEAAEGKAPADG